MEKEEPKLSLEGLRAYIDGRLLELAKYPEEVIARVELGAIYNKLGDIESLSRAESSQMKELRAKVLQEIDWVFNNCDRRTTANLDDVLKLRINAVFDRFTTKPEEKEGREDELFHKWIHKFARESAKAKSEEGV